jgi:hypothetical protein
LKTQSSPEEIRLDSQIPDESDTVMSSYNMTSLATATAVITLDNTVGALLIGALLSMKYVL